MNSKRPLCYSGIKATLCTALLVLLLLAPQAARAGAARPVLLPLHGGPTVELWNVSASGAGQPQADLRLDKPVKFWRAGLTLAEVFAGIKAQTGVQIGFWPAEDQILRGRVNLYLSSRERPSLRALMVQLMWATGCTFACSDVKGQEQARKYYLLSTSVGQGVAARAEREKARAGQARAVAHEEWVSASRRDIEKQLAISANALRLSRRDLLARYRGRDDFLVLTLLDPKRRAALGFVCDLPEQAQKDLLQGKDIFVYWSDLTPRQRADLHAALQFEERWLNEGTVRVYTGGVDHGQVVVGAQVQVPGVKFNAIGRSYQVVCTQAIPMEEMDPWSQIALRRVLGETISPEQEKAYVETWNRAQQQKNARKQNLKSSAGSLTEAMIDTLASLPLALREDRSYALWEIQEIVARASGLNVVSDCFCDMPRNDFRRDNAQSSALEALNMACRPRAELAEMLEDSTPEQVKSCLAWEWGNAGSFLRFRSLHTDIWRASLLPDDVVAQFDQWVAPYLTISSKLGETTRTVLVPLDLRQLAGMVGRLDEMQQRYGLDLIYENPAELASELKQAIREDLDRIVGTDRTFHMLSTFTDRQWLKVSSEGLSFGSELSLDQQADIRPYLQQALLRSRKQIPAGDGLLKVIAPASNAAASNQGGGPGRFEIRFLSAGEEIVVWSKPASIRVDLNSRH